MRKIELSTLSESVDKKPPGTKVWPNRYESVAFLPDSGTKVWLFYAIFSLIMYPSL